MKKKTLAIALVSLALAALAALVGCGQSASSSAANSSEEALPVTESTAASEPVQISKDPFWVLIVGNDTRIGTVDIDRDMYKDGSARSDTMMLARVDPQNYLITLVTIPRDTQDWAFDRVGKINERYQQGGINELMTAVEELTGVRPKYYMDTTFVGFQDLINTMGGLQIFVAADMDMKDIVSGEYMEFPAGDQTLNGAQALIYARERKAYDDYGEVYRQSADRMIVQTMIMQILNNANYADLSSKMFNIVDTNWAGDEFDAYVKDFEANKDKIHFLSGTGPFEGDDLPDADLWVTFRDEDTWRKLIDVVNQGGDPNEVVQGLSLY